MKITRLVYFLSLLGAICIGSGAELFSQLEASEFRYEVSTPQEGTNILPTPLRVLAQSKRKVAGQTGFEGGELATQHTPLLNIINTASEYERVSDYIADPRSSDSIEKRLKRRLVKAESFDVDVRDREHDAQDIFIQLGGHAIFFGYQENYLWRSDFQPKMNIKIPSLGFSEQAASTHSVSYRLYQLDNQLTDIYTRAVRADATSQEAYWQQFARLPLPNHQIGNGLSNKIRGKRLGYIFNTCVQFNNDAKADISFDEKTLCWQYKMAELSSVLPIIPSPKLASNLASIASLVERTIVDKNGNETTDFAFYSIKAGQHINLKTLEWKQK